MYRVLQRLSGLLDCDNRVVSWVSSKMAQQVREITSITEDVVESNARLVENVLSVDPRDLERSGRALQNWLNRYGAEVVQGMDDRSKRVKIRVRSILSDAKSKKGEYLPEVLDNGYGAWCDAGLDASRFYNAIVVYDQAYGPSQSTVANQHLR
ncbi:hypothetical protein [Haloferax sp. ATB1]|uniref:hypothetical protein n=1 Tax=Haloferax sp. ATB1 TaxID=1508454 RepID=UPI001F525683|nr:hypothetical protein [Haloferax sp. ATB1]